MTEPQTAQNGQIGRRSDFWVFGYGSLIWKVDFPIETKRIGYIRGFQRRFYQNSIDHRGTAEKPGRVVTLIPSDTDSVVCGIAYKIPESQHHEVINHLDFREKNGYERHRVTFHPLDGDQQPINDILIYVATKDNASYAGHLCELDVIASQIFDAHGPSGSNREYLYQLAEAMRRIFPDHRDEHLFELERLLRTRENSNGFAIRS